MQLPILVTVLLVLTAAGYYWGRQRSLAIGNGSARHLHWAGWADYLAARGLPRPRSAGTRPRRSGTGGRNSRANARVASLAKRILAGGGAAGRKGEILRTRGEALARLGRCDEALSALEAAVAAGGSGLTPLAAADRVEACRAAQAAPEAPK